MSDSRLSDKVIWVTGASSGIGEALCYQLSKVGANLVLSARRKDVLEKVQAACANPDRHLVLPLDILAPESFANAFQTVRERFGRLDILVNNAGVGQRASALKTDTTVDRQIMNLNFFGPVGLTKLVLPSMLERRAGQIVTISSMMGKFSLPGRSAYSASKHALHGFFDALRAEIEGQGVAITLICPAYIRTNTSFNALDGDGKPYNSWDSDIAGGLAPEECARRIVRAIERRCAEAYVARWEILALYLYRFAPRLFRLVIRAKYGTRS